MNVLSIVSAKGGVGKSTMAANLAVALHEQGSPILAVDLDPQNGLSFHFWSDSGADQGLVHTRGNAAALSNLAKVTPSGVALISYGVCNEAQRQEFETVLAQDPAWLARALDLLELPDDVIVVLDTPPGPSVYMAQALTAATFAAVVMLPDAGSYVTLPQMRALFEQYCLSRPGFRGYGFIVNQVDDRHLLSRDVSSMLRSAFGDRVICRVHQDQAVSESLAFGQSVFQYAPQSEGAYDILACAQNLSEMLIASPQEIRR